MLCLMTDRPRIDERYRSAVGNGGDHDVLGAYGLADRHLTTGWRPTGPDGQGEPVRPAPLAVALERFFAGDAKAVHTIIAIMADKVFEHSWVMQVKISRPKAHDMACAVLAWHRSGTCRACNGHGYDLIPGTPALSERECEPCRGTGKIPFDAQFDDNGRVPQMAQLARWLMSEIERDAGRAAPEAMRALRDRMDL